jgi:hypothetical protein
MKSMKELMDGLPDEWWPKSETGKVLRPAPADDVRRETGARPRAVRQRDCAEGREEA